MLSSSTAAIKLGSLSLDRVEGIVKAAEAAVQRHVEAPDAADDATDDAAQKSEQGQQGGEEGESKDPGKQLGNPAADQQSDGTALEKGGWEQLLVLSLEVLSAWLRVSPNAHAHIKTTHTSKHKVCIHMLLCMHTKPSRERRDTGPQPSTLNPQPSTLNPQP